MAQLIGVDLGGTAIKLGRFSVEGQLLAELEVLTPQPPMPGAVVRSVMPGGPAARAGLRPGDRITAVDGQAVSNPAQLTQLVERNGVDVRVLWSDRGQLAAPQREPLGRPFVQ